MIGFIVTVWLIGLILALVLGGAAKVYWSISDDISAMRRRRRERKLARA